MEVDPKQMKSKDQVESKKKKKQKEKKEKHQNFMKQQPPSAFSCCAHENEYLRINPKPAKNPPACKSCGFKMQGKMGYLCCPMSANCYFLCSTCKVCSKNHMLRNLVSLKQHSSNELYSQNKYSCHGCKVEKAVTAQRGVWHCAPCSFSICPDCMERTESLWDEPREDQ